MRNKEYKIIKNLSFTFLSVLLICITGCCNTKQEVKHLPQSPNILLILAHPDDETMFNLSRFKERGWDMTAVLVTNGENGSIVQAIKSDYDPKKDNDAIIEKTPAKGTWVMQPPSGPKLCEIATHSDLAKERQKEFLNSLSFYGVRTVYFLSNPEHPQFEDNWDNGVKNWNKDLLAKELKEISAKAKPDIIITLNPDETWGHRQHYGLGKIVKSLYDQGLFDTPGFPRPELYGLRENGWYEESWKPQTGDMLFQRDTYSPVLGMSYEDAWTKATDCYVSQSSHPVWASGRIKAGMVPGYRNTDMIRRIDTVSGRKDLSQLFLDFSPDKMKMAQLPATPEVINMFEK